jgi:hypothetical protein
MSIQMIVIVKFQVHDSKSPCQVILIWNVKLTCIGKPNTSVAIVVTSSCVANVVNVGLIVILLLIQLLLSLLPIQVLLFPHFHVDLF